MDIPTTTRRLLPPHPYALEGRSRRYLSRVLAAVKGDEDTVQGWMKSAAGIITLRLIKSCAELGIHHAPNLQERGTEVRRVAARDLRLERRLWREAQKRAESDRGRAHTPTELRAGMDVFLAAWWTTRTGAALAYRAYAKENPQAFN